MAYRQKRWRHLIATTLALLLIAPLPGNLYAEPGWEFAEMEYEALPAVATRTADLWEETESFTPLVAINEYLPQPGTITDWNGDGTANSNDEWIELWNTTDQDIDLSGWQLDDIESGGSPVYLLPTGTMILANSYLVIYKSSQASGINSNIGLNNTGDSIRLLSPDGVLMDEVNYSVATTDVSYWRHPLTHEWNTTDVPTPGQINITLPPTEEEEVPEPEPEEPTPRPDEPDPELPVPEDPTPVEPKPETPPGEEETEIDPAILTSVRLNEILPTPGNTMDWDKGGKADSHDEWVEIYNGYSSSVDLSGWTLDDLPTGGSKAYTLPAGSVIAADGYLILNKSTVGSIPGTGLALNNTGDEVVLSTPDGEIVDRYAFEETKTDVAWARTPGSLVWTSTSTPTPGERNQITDETTEEIVEEQETPEAVTPVEPDPETTAVVYSTQVRLNELLPSPSGDQDLNTDGKTNASDELIELYNGSAAAVDLSGWRLDDVADGGSSPYAIPSGTSIPRKGYLAFVRTPGQTQLKHPLTLNDGADCVRLLDPTGKEKSKHCYENHPKGMSLAYDQSDKRWKVTSVVTPGQANHFVGLVEGDSDTVPDPMSVSQIKDLPLGSRIHLIATVTTPPGVFSARRFYVQDETGQGIAVEITDGIIPALKLGDQIRIRSSIEQKNAEFYIKTTGASLEILAAGKPPQPQVVKIAELDETREGQLVRIAGQVVESSGATFVVRDSSGTMRVQIDPDTLIKKPRTTKGTAIQVTGIFSQYRISSTKGDGYRILPRVQSDIYLPKGRVAGLATTGPAGEKLLLFLLPMLAVSLLGFHSWKQRLRTRPQKRSLSQALSHAPYAVGRSSRWTAN